MQLLTLARESDLLLIGELHGTQEVPRLMLGLLHALARLGYGGLALEMLTCEREQLLRCAQGKDTLPPMFGPSDFRDGRGNAQAFSLIQQAVQSGWELLCFDVDFMQESDAWSVRDRGMAQNLLHQWEQLCPERKVLGVCGSYHSRLVPPTEPTELWPSFAYSVQQARPDLRGEFCQSEVSARGLFQWRSFARSITAQSALLPRRRCILRTGWATPWTCTYRERRPRRSWTMKRVRTSRKELPQ